MGVLQISALWGRVEGCLFQECPVPRTLPDTTCQGRKICSFFFFFSFFLFFFFLVIPNGYLMGIMKRKKWMKKNMGQFHFLKYPSSKLLLSVTWPADILGIFCLVLYMSIDRLHAVERAIEPNKFGWKGESLWAIISKVVQTGGTGPGFAKTGDEMRSQDKNSTEIGDGTGALKESN